MVSTAALSRALQECSTRDEFRGTLRQWLFANVTAFQTDRASMKATFSPTRQPKYYNVLALTLIMWQKTGELKKDGYDISFAADADRFSIIKIR